MSTSETKFAPDTRPASLLEQPTVNIEKSLGFQLGSRRSVREKQN